MVYDEWLLSDLDILGLAATDLEGSLVAPLLSQPTPDLVVEAGLLVGSLRRIVVSPVVLKTGSRAVVRLGCEL